MLIRNHPGKVNRGKFIPSDPKEFSKAFLHHEGKPVVVSVKRKTRDRSNQQNRYYWGVVIKILGDHFGYTDLEMHEALKFEFLRVEEQGKPITCKSTSQLSTVEFEQYLENVKRWAVQEYHTYIPDPGVIEYG